MTSEDFSFLIYAFKYAYAVIKIIMAIKREKYLVELQIHFGQLLDIRFKYEGFNSFDSYDSTKKDFHVSYKEKSFSQEIKMISRTINLFNSKIIIFYVKILSRQTNRIVAWNFE